jgi:hypothetical protein
MGLMFELVIGTEMLHREDGTWSAGSSRALIDLIERIPVRPYALTAPSPVIEPSWSDEVWVWLHVWNAIDLYKITGVRIVQRPQMPDTSIPPGAVS